MWMAWSKGDGGLSCGGVGGVGLCASRACCCDAMVGASAELDFTQAGLADCDTVVDVCDVVVCGGDTVIEGLCVGDMVSGVGDTVGCCVDTAAVIEGLCDGGMVSGVGDTVGCCVDTAAVIEGLCDGGIVSGVGDTVGCCVDTAAVIEGLCDGGMVSGLGDTVGCCVDTAAVIEGLCDVDRVA